MHAVIFGAGGQDGHYLAAHLASEGITVTTVSRSAGDLRGSVGDSAFVDAVLRGHRPHYVFHLAANSVTRHEAMREHHDTIGGGTLNVLESARAHCPDARVFLSGTALQFQNTGRPIDEHAPFAASSAYAVERIHSVYAGRYFRSAFGLRAYVGYFFHHDSPRRSERHVSQKIVRAAQRIAAGSGERLSLGNVEVRKEFGFAGDVVRAAWMLVNQEETFEAVIGTGHAYPIRDWVAYCFAARGLDWRDHVTISTDPQTPFGILVSDPHTIKAMGWSPRVGFEALADLMLADGEDAGPRPR